MGAIPATTKKLWGRFPQVAPTGILALFPVLCREPREYPHKPYIASLDSRVIGYIFVADSMGLSSLKFSWWAPKDAYDLKQSA